MDSRKIVFPSYAKFALILLSGVLLFYILSRASVILIPVTLAFLLSMILLPIYRKLLGWKFPRSLSAILCIFVLLIILGIILFFMGSQIARISKDLPAIGEQLNAQLGRFQSWVSDQWGINESEQAKYLQNNVNIIAQRGSSFLSGALNTTTQVVTFLLLLVIPLFFFLFYHEFLKTFVLSAVKADQHNRVRTLIADVEKVVMNYLSGVVMVMIILAILNTVGLKIIGVKYALFFGVTAALLNIIPFIGVVIGSLLPIAYAALTMDSLWYPVAIAGLFWFVQFIEGNIITPNIVGGKVSLNPFAAIIALFVGGQVWGAAGMILFIPLTAMLKVLCDNVDSLKPYGFLLGEPGHAPYEDSWFTKMWKKITGKS